MIVHREEQHPSTPSKSRVAVVALALALTLAGCSGKEASAKSADAHTASASRGSRVVACTLMPKEEVNALTGSEYTKSESSDDGRSSGSSCQYATESNPTGMTLGITWINPKDYSDPAEHAALQKASIGGANLAGKLTSGMAPGGIPGIPSGPIEGVGDEATVSMALLTARKGDYTVMVQIVPSNMMAFLQDSTVAIALLEKEKAVARKIFAKL